MKVLLIVAFLSVIFHSSYETVIGYDDPQQQLLIYRQQNIVVNRLLKSECSQIFETRQLESDYLTSAHIDVAKELYNSLIQKLAECRAKKLKVNEKTAASTFVAPHTTTTTPATTTTTTSQTTTTTKPTTNSTTTAPTTTTTPVYKDCQELYEHGYNQSGVYEINLPNLPPFDVWCDFFGNHGWTVIQRRAGYNMSFYRTWNEYKEGFGDVSENYWLGNERIHILTKTNQKLNIKLGLKDGGERNGTWSKFYISDESDNYRLTVPGSGYTGDITPDYLSQHHNDIEFSTRDRDNDLSMGSNCADTDKAGWWYNSCGYVFLNSGASVFGMDWDGYDYPLRSSVMRVTRQEIIH